MQEAVWNQYEVIRRDGTVNMFDKNRVQQIANKKGMVELVDTIDEGKYAELLENYSKDKFDEERVNEIRRSR